MEKLINMNSLQVKKYYHRRVLEQAEFTYFPLGKALEKETKIIEDQGKKQVKAMEDHGKQLVECIKLIKKDFNIDRDSIPLEKQQQQNI